MIANDQQDARPSADPVDGPPGAGAPAPHEWIGRRSRLWRAVEGAVFVGVLGMLLMVAIQVLSRLFQHSLPWTEEITRYLFIWTVFLGLAAGFRSVEHTRITLLLHMVPGRLRAAATHIYFLAGVVFFSIVAFTGWRLVVQQFQSGESSPALGMGMFTVTAAVVVGAVLSLWAHIETVYLDAGARSVLDEEAVDP